MYIHVSFYVLYTWVYICVQIHIYTHISDVCTCVRIHKTDVDWLDEQSSQQIFPRNDAYPIPHTNARTHITPTHVHVRTRSLAHPPIHTHPLTHSHVRTHAHTNSIEYSFIFMYQKMLKALLPTKQPWIFCAKNALCFQASFVICLCVHIYIYIYIYIYYPYSLEPVSQFLHLWQQTYKPYTRNHEPKPPHLTPNSHILNLIP